MCAGLPETADVVFDLEESGWMGWLDAGWNDEDLFEHINRSMAKGLRLLATPKRRLSVHGVMLLLVEW